MCKNLMKLDIFESAFLEPLIKLATDPVKNVRVSVARVVAKHIKTSGRYDLK